jgi:hypothetical protein
MVIEASFRASINSLKNQSADGGVFSNHPLSVNHHNQIKCFLGSYTSITLSSENFLLLDSPACIAAPIVNIIARNSISIGIPEDNSTPVRLYVPLRLTLVTPNLSIGDCQLLQKPQQLIIKCDFLTVVTPKEENPMHLEIVQDHNMNGYINLTPYSPPFP